MNKTIYKIFVERIYMWALIENEDIDTEKMCMGVFMIEYEFVRSKSIIHPTLNK